METTNEVNWPEAIWNEINDGVVKEVAKVRVAQKAFPAKMLDSHPTQIVNEVIDFTNLNIREGETKPLVEIHSEFSLTSTQVNQEAEQKTCATLAKMAAKTLALFEDAYWFQVSDRSPAVRDANDRPNLKVNFPGGVTIENHRRDLDFGLLAEANPPDANNVDSNKVTIPIVVNRLTAPGSLATWGENTFAKVTEGITDLVAKGQARNYALFLPTEVYADTYVPPSPASLVTTADRIKPLVEGGYYSSGTLPKDEGLLVALGGEPIKLYVGWEAHTEFIQKKGARYFFRVMERVQYVVRDARSLVLLRFAGPAPATPPPAGGPTPKK